MLYQMYINGEWHEEEKKKEVISPVNGEKIGSIPLGTKETIDLAVKSAENCKQKMRSMTVFERARILFQIADSIEQKQQNLAELLTLEHGKTINESLGEVASTATAFRDAAEQIKWLNSEIIPTRDKNKRAFSYRRPRGVYGVISPWNFPLGNASSYYIAPGLAAGNTIVWVPALSTSAVASEFMKCIHETDLPKGAFNLVIGEGPIAGDALVTHNLTSAIGFTGSTQTGEIIHSRAGAKPVSLELGGNGPTIVLDNADPQRVAETLIKNSFANAGQICTSTERVIIHESIADIVANELIEQIKNVKLGDPFDSKSTMGPVHNENTINTVKEHINDAVDKGAKVLTKANDKKYPTNLYSEPIIIDYVSKNTKLNKEETFGPVIPLIRYSDKQELLDLINSSPYRLSSSIFSQSYEDAMNLAEKLNFGFININEASNYWETQIPAGGASGFSSGYGRSGGLASIKEMSETCTIILNMPGDIKNE